MHAGKLDHWITLQELTTSRDPVYGSVVETWADARPCWAFIEYGTGGERAEMGQLQAALQLKIHIRSYPAVNNQMRVKETTKEGIERLYHIVAWYDDPRADETILTCTAWREATV